MSHDVQGQARTLVEQTTKRRRHAFHESTTRAGMERTLAVQTINTHLSANSSISLCKISKALFFCNVHSRWSKLSLCQSPATCRHVNVKQKQARDHAHQINLVQPAVFSYHDRSSNSYEGLYISLAVYPTVNGTSCHQDSWPYQP